MKYNPTIVQAFFDEHLLFADLEYQFHPLRKWRFDFVFFRILGPKSAKGALEVEGGVWTSGRHTRGSGFVADMEKYNEAARLGWRVLRVQPKDLCTMDTVKLIKDTLNA